MPYPAQVDRQTLIQSAWQFIDQNGIERLSLAKLASQFGIKAPSLYRHVGNKASLIRAVNLLTVQKLFVALNTAKESTPAGTKPQLIVILQAYRTFAHAHPHVYQLALLDSRDEHRPDENTLEQLVLPIQELVAGIVPAGQSLSAIRGAMALVHGFVLLEINNQLRRGGNLDEAFTLSITAYLSGW